MISQLLGRVQSYLYGNFSLSDLAVWFAENLTEILEANDLAAKQIADELDADLIWLHEGLITEEEFRRRLEKLIKPHTIMTSASNKFYYSSHDFFSIKDDYSLFSNDWITTNFWRVIGGEQPIYGTSLSKGVVLTVNR